STDVGGGEVAESTRAFTVERDHYLGTMGIWVIHYERIGHGGRTDLDLGIDEIRPAPRAEGRVLLFELDPLAGSGCELGARAEESAKVARARRAGGRIEIEVVVLCAGRLIGPGLGVGRDPGPRRAGFGRDRLGKPLHRGRAVEDEPAYEASPR